jgi:Flp pilus assembly protein TadG
MLSEREDGQLSLFIIGLVGIAALLVTAGIDASKVFLAQRALSSAADAAALKAAQAVDRDAVYSGSSSCGGLLPIDPARASSYADATVADADLQPTFATLEPTEVDVRDGTVTVRLSGSVAVPFGKVLAMLVPGHADGRVHVTVTSHAQAPLSEPGGC